MRRLLPFGVLGLVALLALAGVVTTRTLVRDATPYPCISTSSNGWLTAVSAGLLLRLEWSESSGQLSIGREHAPVRWQEVGSEAARQTANHVLQPLSGSGRAVSAGEVSLYVGCDGSGHFWRGGNADLVPWRECVWPGPERRVDCLKRAIASRRSADGIAGGLVERISSLATANGVIP
ncbi:MAG: hypothetical protein SFW67_00405 [Myxococcaceae bacterium]|nr:hypothetical protein [Myxococcaceae bacterium]